MDDNLQRKSEKLYGPQRLVEAELQSRKLKKDNVLVKGMVYDSPYDPRSTARDSFKVNVHVTISLVYDVTKNFAHKWLFCTIRTHLLEKLEKLRQRCIGTPLRK